MDKPVTDLEKERESWLDCLDRVDSQILEAERAIIAGEASPERGISYLRVLHEARDGYLQAFGAVEARLDDAKLRVRATQDRDPEKQDAAAWTERSETIGAARVPEAVVERSAPVASSRTDELDWLRNNQPFPGDDLPEVQDRDRQDDLDWLREDITPSLDRGTDRDRERER